MQEPGGRQQPVQAPWMQGLRVLAAATAHLALCLGPECCSLQPQLPPKFPKRVRGDGPQAASSSRSSVQSRHSIPGHAGHLMHIMFSLEILIFFSSHARRLLC